jgi:hypothetical protein
MGTNEETMHEKPEPAEADPERDPQEIGPADADEIAGGRLDPYKN